MTVARASHSFARAAHRGMTEATFGGMANPAMQTLPEWRWQRLARVTFAWHSGNPADYYGRYSGEKIGR